MRNDPTDHLTEAKCLRMPLPWVLSHLKERKVRRPPQAIDPELRALLARDVKERPQIVHVAAASSAVPPAAQRSPSELTILASMPVRSQADAEAPSAEVAVSAGVASNAAEPAPSELSMPAPAPTGSKAVVAADTQPGPAASQVPMPTRFLVQSDASATYKCLKCAQWHQVGCVCPHFGLKPAVDHPDAVARGCFPSIEVKLCTTDVSCVYVQNVVVKLGHATGDNNDCLVHTMIQMAVHLSLSLRGELAQAYVFAEQDDPDDGLANFLQEVRSQTRYFLQRGSADQQEAAARIKDANQLDFSLHALPLLHVLCGRDPAVRLLCVDVGTISASGGQRRAEPFDLVGEGDKVGIVGRVGGTYIPANPARGSRGIWAPDNHFVPGVAQRPISLPEIPLRGTGDRASSPTEPVHPQVIPR